MFQRPFVDKILSGAKTTTIRGWHDFVHGSPKPGVRESLRYWATVAYKSRQIEFATAKAASFRLIKLTTHGMTFREESLVVEKGGMAWRDKPLAVDREAIAKAEGFASWEEMRTWFELNRGLSPEKPFCGILIQYVNIVPTQPAS